MSATLPPVYKSQCCVHSVFTLHDSDLTPLKGLRVVHLPHYTMSKTLVSEGIKTLLSTHPFAHFYPFVISGPL